MSDKIFEGFTKEDLDRMIDRMVRKRRQDGAVFHFDNSKLWADVKKMIEEAETV